MKKPIVNIEELELKTSPVPMPDSVKAKYEGAKLGQAGMLLESVKLGYSVIVLPLGKSAFPLHNHRVNEEMFFILEGSGEVQIGTDKFPIRKGDFIACPPGGKEVAHQITNTGSGELKYLGVSTKESPEIADYPNTGKFGILTKDFRFLGKADQSLNYWDGE